MNNKIAPETRIAFRDWLRKELRKDRVGGNFYLSRGDHYLIREFSKFCHDRGEELSKATKKPVDLDIDEASLGRYLRDLDPVIPTPERCRTLAQVLGYQAVEVLIKAGYTTKAELDEYCKGR